MILLHGRIAGGASGDVRRVRDAVLDRVLAMKVLRWEYVDSTAMRAGGGQGVRHGDDAEFDKGQHGTVHLNGNRA